MTSELQDQFGVSAEEYMIEYLRDGVAFNMNGNYSVTPADFLYTVPAGKRLTLRRMAISVTDSGAFEATKYGALPALTNGIHISIHDEDDVQLVNLTPEDIKTNAMLMAIAQGRLTTFAGSSDNTLNTLWELPNIQMDEGWYIHCELSDNLTGLVQHTIRIEGYLLDSP